MIRISSHQDIKFKDDCSYFSVAGDIVPFTDDKTFVISQELQAFLKKIKLNVVNLESPITSNSNSIDKIGPSLKSSSKEGEILSLLHVNLACLSNNHINDFGEKGIKDTISFLKEKGIGFCGVGDNIHNARQPYIHNADEMKIGFINICEHEYSIATEKNWGANPIDLFSIHSDIAGLQKKVDLIIVIIHGGKEGYPFPNPFIYNLFHLIADLGAAIVIGHHSHIVSGYESYSNIPLLYGLGNFFFYDKAEICKDWYTGFLSVIEISEKAIKNVFLVPLILDLDNAILRFVNDVELEDIKKNINDINSVIYNKKSINEEWIKYTEKVGHGYVKRILGLNKLQKALYKLGLIKISTDKKRTKMFFHHYINCETHAELLKTFLQK